MDQPDVLAGRKPVCCRDWSDGNVDGIPPTVTVFDQLAESWSLIHISSLF
jgi:hypothetical protein